LQNQVLKSLWRDQIKKKTIEGSKIEKGHELYTWPCKSVFEI
jgi:hypothetical protein